MKETADEDGRKQKRLIDLKARKIQNYNAKVIYDEESRQYFESITDSPVLFIEVIEICKPFVYIDLRNLIVLVIYEAFKLETWIKLCIICKRHETSNNQIPVDSSTLGMIKLESSTIFNDNTECCYQETFKNHDEKFKSDITNEARKHPSINVFDKNMIICGISSVLRFILKFACYKLETNTDEDTHDVMQQNMLANFRQFLGFRGGCLQACAESSVWTKFCEVDMLTVINDIKVSLDKLKNSHDIQTLRSGELMLPDSLIRFEHHLNSPVKIHNFRKKIQDIKKANPTTRSEVVNDSCQIEKVSELNHEFAEGPVLLLSDLILYPSVNICKSFFGQGTLKRFLPKTLEWHEKVCTRFHGNFSLNFPDGYTQRQEILEELWTVPQIPIQSLYSRDPDRYKSTLRQYTRQYDVDETLEFVKSRSLAYLDIQAEEPTFKWTNIPLLAHPEGGCLPKIRQQRKCDQLASLSHHALQVYEEKRDQYNCNKFRRFRIVDFCSGGGHLGILLAWLLPKCDVVLVENKDESVRRAQMRIKGLGLSNVFCYQSNVDYFEGSFDLGVALHACGTATDLVITKCISMNASFVCCPCCYGAMQENHILTYPRSTVFKSTDIPLRNYFILCHASDQTHGESHEKSVQGKQCMTIVDSDRCFYAAENGYTVKLSIIVPETASPKNHILVGVSQTG